MNKSSQMTSDAESIAKYHDERAGFGGVGWEFHARAATLIRDHAAEIERLHEAIRHGTTCMCEPCRRLRASVF